MEPSSGAGKAGENPQIQQVQQFRKSAELFRSALEEYHETDPKNTQKLQEFKSVMDKAMRIMSETAQEACRSKKLQSAKKRLDKDYQKFHQDFESKDPVELNQDYQVLEKDIKNLEEHLQ